MKNSLKKIGTSFEDKSETTLTGRGLMPWEQKVADERTGKRKFHGAFTGGFSAGYKNTCGSETGFNPAVFTSTRHQRASVKQEINDFMDDEDLDQIDLRKNLLAQQEKVGEKLMDYMEDQSDEEYGPTMPPVIEESQPKSDSFGLGYTPNTKPVIISGSIKAPADIYSNYIIEEGNEPKNLIAEASIKLSTEIPGFVLKLTLEETPKFPPPQLPANYNPRTFLMHQKTQSHRTTKPKESSLETQPLFSGVLSVDDIQRIRKLKTFVKSNDTTRKTSFSLETLPFTHDPIKNSRCYNFFCLMEGLEIGGISQAHLMTASQIQKEKEEFMSVYTAWKKNGPKPPEPQPIKHVQRSTDRKVEPWKPSKLLCIGFNLPQPQRSVIEQRPVNVFKEQVLPVVKTSETSAEIPEDSAGLIKEVFADCNSGDQDVEIMFKKRKYN